MEYHVKTVFLYIFAVLQNTSLITDETGGINSAKNVVDQTWVTEHML